MAAIGSITGDHEVQVLRERLAEAERRLAERQVIDRAKGLLMAAGLTEDEAYLHLLDRIWQRHNLKGRLQAHLVRYADDFVVLCRREVQEPLNVVHHLLGRLDFI